MLFVNIEIMINVANYVEWATKKSAVHNTVIIVFNFAKIWLLLRYVALIFNFFPFFFWDTQPWKARLSSTRSWCSIAIW